MPSAPCSDCRWFKALQGKRHAFFNYSINDQIERKLSKGFDCVPLRHKIHTHTCCLWLSACSRDSVQCCCSLASSSCSCCWTLRLCMRSSSHWARSCDSACSLCAHNSTRMRSWDTQDRCMYYNHPNTLLNHRRVLKFRVIAFQLHLLPEFLW